MGEIVITSEKEGVTNISNIFIEHYMSDANGDFVKLYLYLAMLCSTSRMISVSDIADHLNCTENDVCRGIRYWIKADAVALKYNDAKEVIGIVLKTLRSPETDLANDLKVVNFKLAVGRSKKTKDDNVDNEEAVNEATDNSVKAPRKKQPSSAEIKELETDQDLKNLISEAEAYCERDLKQQELNSLIYIKSQLGFSFDLTEYLLEYCAEIKKTSFKYIEAVARNWYEEGITNRTDAAEYTERYWTLFTKIIKALGITNRTSLTPVEKKFIDTWTKEYAFSDTIIIEACNRGILQKPKDVTFFYVDGILSDWYKNNVHTISDITALDEKHEKRKSANAESTRPGDDSLDQLKQIENLYLKKGSS